MTYFINASQLKQLYGFDLHTKTLDGSPATIHIPKQPDGWPRGGAEAYGLKTELRVQRSSGLETIPAFLKLFKTEVQEREQRTRLLIMMELAKKSDFFFGIPFGWLGRLSINGVVVIAHFTRMIKGPYNGGPEDFSRLRSSGLWAAIGEARRRNYAGEIAAAIAGLERARITHGDISPGNMVIGHSSANKDICILCDYDGYHNHQVPRLPRRDGKTPCRPLGSPGYQYPDLLAQIEADTRGDGDIWVETDRFALGVAICEMMVWSDRVDKILQQEGRGQLIPNEVIAARDLNRMPRQIIDSFPEGFKLLDKALHATGHASMPSPEDWLRVLGFDEAKEFAGLPLITIFRRRGTARAKQNTYRLTKPAGDFNASTPELGGVTYTFSGKKLEFNFKAGQSIKRRRESRLADITAGLGPLAANAGDIYYVGDWELEVTDSVSNP